MNSAPQALCSIDLLPLGKGLLGIPQCLGSGVTGVDNTRLASKTHQAQLGQVKGMLGAPGRCLPFAGFSFKVGSLDQASIMAMTLLAGPAARPGAPPFRCRPPPGRN